MSIGSMMLFKNNVKQPTASIVTSGLAFNLRTAPSSGTTWTDATGNGYNGTLNGSASYVSSNGGGIKLNNADNTGTDYISVPYNINATVGTVEIIASFNPTSFWGSIWGNEAYNASKGYFAYMPNSTSITWGSPKTDVTTATITASDAVRQWIFVIDNTSKSLYLNGSQFGTTVTIPNPSGGAVSSDFFFGARHGNGGSGPIDKMNNSNASFQPVFYQMRFYNRALSSAEITANYNAVKTTYGI